MKRIALVNQRYGLEVNGGSEYYTRLIAEKLKEYYDVHVITTKAVDYITWKDYYKNDYEEINGIKVHRFSVDCCRNSKRFGKVNADILTKSVRTEEDEQKWIDEQGPLSTQLVSYIKDHKDDYDVFIFVTYLYYTTTMGLPCVADKSILIPTAHDEPYIYFNRFKRIFTMPKAIVYLTDEEKRLVQHLFHNENIINETMGVGIDVPEDVDANMFKKKHNLSDYIIYVGRIDEAKGCKWLFQYFEEYKKRNKQDVKLVLMGKNVIDIPSNPDILNLGFVSEEEKYNGIAGAKALILPSKFESLSISALESLSLGVPVIMNGLCEVLKGHCVKSNAGLYYRNYFEFEGCLNYILTHESDRKAMQQNGREYVDKYYRWEVIIEKFNHVIDDVIKSRVNV